MGTVIDYTRCAYHQSHKTRQVQRRLSDHKLLDVPRVRSDLDKTLDLTIFDWSEYSDDTFSTYDFCPGQDVVSYCLDVQGIWEPMECLAVLDILRTPGVVVDIGSHIGWYGAIAAASKCDVHMVEANPESATLANVNATANRQTDRVTFNQVQIGMVGSMAPVEPWEIRLFISDVEGAEADAVEYCRDSFADRLVDYAMLEMSPVFNDSYPQLTADFNSWGYTGFQVPHKGEWLVEYGLDPLGVLLSQRPVTPEVVAGWHQESVVFTVLT